MAKASKVVETVGGFSFEFGGKTYTYTSRKVADHMAQALPRAAKSAGMAGVHVADARAEARRFRKQ